jgi:uncharacterized protein (TIGR03382 family)
MTSRLMVSAIGALIFTAGASAGLIEVTIDFESAPGDGAIAGETHLHTQFQDWGVSMFTSVNPNGPLVMERSFTGQSGSNVLMGAANPADPFTNAYQPIGVFFEQPVMDVSINALDVGRAGIRMTGYDSFRGVVDMVEYTGEGGGAGSSQILSLVGAGITEIKIEQITPGLGGDGYAIDDLSFFTEAIPTPGAMALLGAAGLVGLGRRRR